VLEQPLPGGFVSQVVRVGDTVRRLPGPRAAFVRELLEFLEERGWAGAPRFTGSDQRGREILGFIDGQVAWQPDQHGAVSADAGLIATAELMRQFHDLTVGTPLTGAEEVVCHNDLSPKNTVYRDLGSGLIPVAFIDWDIAAPGQRVHDVAHVCWQYVGLGPGIDDAAAAARRVRLICDAYRLADRVGLVDVILWWQVRCWRGVEAAAAAGDPAMTRLHEGGATASVRQQHEWVARHRSTLGAALR
jgi:Phosphotransferase enzyme family